MSSPPTFADWTASQLGLTTGDLEQIKIGPVFELFISRIEEARRRGAADPLTTVTAKQAGGNSRACTRRMLEQLGFSAPQRRAVHRLLAGSPSGWPGLLRLYAASLELSQEQRQYARRQLQTIRAHRACPRSGSSAGCSAKAVTP
ncbi:hypothetical protein [Terrabacter sp. MAHUQ-38]|uniref:hypothetical protein n=1 Tax=unclassified Terrabacter TaxID=2630222 RepID=UPI00165DFCE7|nr:hypothetical protein [Terrabacter sp. MAHUQ-38]MBC9822860.1 hypothetical protein [Terrabacter sp. MAHUQ-38]